MCRTWRASGRRSPHKVSDLAPTRLHDAVCASDGRLRLRGGCAGGNTRELARLVAGAPAGLNGAAHHDGHGRAPGRAGCAAERRGLRRQHLTVRGCAARPTRRAISMLRQPRSVSLGAAAGACGGLGAGASCTVTGARAGLRAWRWDAVARGLCEAACMCV